MDKIITKIYELLKDTKDVKLIHHYLSLILLTLTNYIRYANNHDE